MSAKTGLCHHLCLVMADRRHFLTFFDAFQRFSTLFDAFRRFSTFFDVFQRFSTFIRKKYQRTPFNFCLTSFIEQLCFVWTVLGSGDASGSDDGIQKSSSKILHPELFFHPITWGKSSKLHRSLRQKMLALDDLLVLLARLLAWWQIGLGSLRKPVIN